MLPETALVVDNGHCTPTNNINNNAAPLVVTRHAPTLPYHHHQQLHSASNGNSVQYEHNLRQLQQQQQFVNAAFAARNRASLCLSPVTGAVLSPDAGATKRRSWCGTPVGAASFHGGGHTHQTTPVKRYGELAPYRQRSDASFLDQQPCSTYFGAHEQRRVLPSTPTPASAGSAHAGAASSGAAAVLLGGDSTPSCDLSPASECRNPFFASKLHHHQQNVNSFQIHQQPLLRRNSNSNGNNAAMVAQQMQVQQHHHHHHHHPHQPQVVVPLGNDADFLNSSRSPSRGSLVSSTGGSDAGSEDSGDTGYGAACDLGLLERLRRSHPIWFLPGIQRSGAFHLLQGKEEGCFVVRQSSQSKTMALSVRLPPDKGPYIEHYLIQSSDQGLGLETSENRFVDMPALIAHYAGCCDELPVQLTLPRAIRDATSRQQLSSLALLGSEFWRYSPPPSQASSPDTEATNHDLVLGQLHPLMSTFKQAELSNTPTGEHKPVRPCTLNLASKSEPTAPNTMTTTRTIPALKNELLSATRTPPPPPPRWSKPSTPQQQQQNNNFTVTTTFTIQVNPDSPRTPVDNSESSTAMTTSTTTTSKRMSPDGKTSTLSSKGSLRRAKIEHIISPSGSTPGSDPSSCLMSPDTLSPLVGTKIMRHSRRVHHKQPHKASKHYQESDILDSPTVYYRSQVGDKISDYEDVWASENNTFNRSGSSNNNGVSSNLASPDILAHTSGGNNNMVAINNSINNNNNNGSAVLSPSVDVKSIILNGDVVVSKPTSPFYAEPADSLSSAAANVSNTTHFVSAAAAASRAFNARSSRNGGALRHSNPVVVSSGGGGDCGGGSGFVSSLQTGRIESVASSSELNGMSTSVDNLNPKQRGVMSPMSQSASSTILSNNNPTTATTTTSPPVILKKPDLKPVQPPTIKAPPPPPPGAALAHQLQSPPFGHQQRSNAWQVDNNWRFMGNECDINMDSSDADYDGDWPARIPTIPLSPYTHDPEHSCTLDEILAKRLPNVRTASDLLTDDDSRISSYDNVDDKHHLRIPRAPPSEISELTEFSEPWNEISHGVITETDDSFSEMNSNSTPKPTPKLASINRARSFKDRLDPLVLSASKLQCLRNSREQQTDRAIVGAAIRNYALDLATDKSTTFAQNIDNFIACTCESKEINPQIIMRNMRQFMSGMKNYLVKHGEKEFNREVEKERNKLKSTEFLNLDAILEGVLHKLVVKPLKSHLQKLFIDHYTKTGGILLLAENIKYANTRPEVELSIKPKISLPTESALQTIQDYLKRLQNADSPLEKLEYLLAAIAAIFNSVKLCQLSGSEKIVTLGADDFLPIFVWVLIKTNFITAEIEAEYMWGLLHPSLLSGEGGYYLTTLSSAVHVLKTFRENNQENLSNNVKSDVSAFKSVLKVIVPDELHGSIVTKTLPVRPHMTIKEVCKIIAHKARITNPQDFALYCLEDGEETMLADNDCPQDFMNKGKHVMLAYKRIDAKIAWPRQQKN